MLKQSPIGKTLFMCLILSAAWSSNPTQADDQTFKNVCKKCHTGGFKGLLSGAPNIKKPSHWEEILERDSVEDMRKIVINGTDDHKRRGGCKNCSDEEIVSAIDYMLARVKQQ